MKRANKDENNFFCKKIVLITCVIIVTISCTVIMGLKVFSNIYENQIVLSCDGITFNRNDYMMYLRLAKTSLFDENTNKLPNATLNTIVDKDTNTNVDTYLRNKVEQSLKISGAVQALAKKYSVTLNQEQLDKIKQDKNDYIDSLGGIKAFKTFLKDNKTTEEAYDKMAYSDMLYKTLYENLYASGKVNDLTEKEKEKARDEYIQNYYKARQILFITVDPATKEKLPEQVIEQKKLLADAVRKQLTSESDFDEYIKKYSDDAVNSEQSYDMYFKSGEVLQEIEETVKNLNIGEVSDVVNSNYAFHIIKRDTLDDSYLEKIYETKREEKFMEDINNQIKSSTIIIEDNFTNMKII